MNDAELRALVAKNRELADKIGKQIKAMRAELEAAKARELAFIAAQNERKESEKKP